MNDNNLFPEMQPEKKDLLGIPADIWKIILRNLSRQDMLLARFWSKSFRAVLRDPLTDDLRQTSQELGYNVDVDISELNFLTFSARNDGEETLAEKLTAIRGLRLLCASKTEQAQLNAIDVIAKATLFKHLSTELLGFAIYPRNPQAKFHPFIVSACIEALYLLTLSKPKEKSLIRIFSNYLKLITLTPEQKARFRIARAFSVMRNSTLTPERRKSKLEKIFDTKIADGRLPDEKFTQILLGLHVRSSNMSECLTDALKYYEGKSDKIIVPVSRPHHIAHSRYQIYEHYLYFEKSTPLTDAIIKAAKDKNLAALPWEDDINNQRFVILSFTNRIFYELFVRAGLFEKIPKDDFVANFMAYYARPEMQQVLAFNPPLEFAPLWLRRYLFTPDLLTKEEHDYLKQWNLSKFPRFFFKKDFSFQKLKELELLFELFELGIHVDEDEAVVLANNSYETLCAVTRARNTSLRYKDVLYLLKHADSQTLTQFIQSSLFREITLLGINNLYFWRWVATNQNFLSGVLRTQPNFFRQTVRQLFSLRRVLISKELTASEKPDVIFPQNAQTISVTYFELIRRTLEVSTSEFQRVRLLGQVLCENVFTPAENENVLFRIMNVNPAYDLGILFAQVYRKSYCNAYEIETKFIRPVFKDTYDMKIYLPSAKKRPKKQKNKKRTPKHQKTLEVFSQSEYQQLVHKMLSCKELISDDSIPDQVGCFPFIRLLNDSWRTPHKKFNSKIFSLIERFIKLNIIDQPDLCCAYITRYGVKSLLSKEPCPPFDLPVEDNDSPVISPDEIPQEFQWLLQPSHRALLKKFVFENITPATEILRLFAQSNLADKPDHCCLLLDHYGVERLMTFPSLEIFSTASSGEVLSDTVKDIREKARECNLSEKDYIAKHSNKIEEMLLAIVGSFDFAIPYNVLVASRNNNEDGELDFGFNADFFELDMKALDQHSLWHPAEPVAHESDPKKQKTGPEIPPDVVLGLFHPS